MRHLIEKQWSDGEKVFSLQRIVCETTPFAYSHCSPGEDVTSHLNKQQVLTGQ